MKNPLKLTIGYQSIITAFYGRKEWPLLYNVAPLCFRGKEKKSRLTFQEAAVDGVAKGSRHSVLDW